jgi:hypothetical protein
MSSLNKVVAPRKLCVTVTVEYDQSKTDDVSNSKEFGVGVRKFLAWQIISQFFEMLRRLFWPIS